jgi:CO/xanthine dehydrogenase FAD-binding subunit
MKPARFDYYAPQSLDEAISLLSQHGGDARVLAGGQSLMPMMAMRLARPPVVVDINRIGALEHITSTDGGGLNIGALTRERAVELSDVVAQRFPMLSDMVPHIGHFQIRNRGTVGGSIAHADPSAEWPAFAIASDAQIVLQSSAGSREVSAEDFFITYFTTAVETGEMVTEVRLPGSGAGWGWGFEEVCRRHGDFAMTGAFTRVHLDGNGACDDSRIVIFGVGGTPVRVESAEAALRGSNGEMPSLEQVAAAVSDALDPDSDIHASALYRKEVSGVMARRALVGAFRRARGEES